MAQRHERATVNATVLDSILTRGNEIFNIFISSFWLRGKAQHRVLPLNGNENRSILIEMQILTLGSRVQQAAHAQAFCMHEVKKISRLI